MFRELDSDEEKEFMIAGEVLLKEGLGTTSLSVIHPVTRKHMLNQILWSLEDQELETGVK